MVPPGEDPNEYAKRGDWGKEAIMDDDESPLSAVMRWPENRGKLRFDHSRTHNFLDHASSLTFGYI